MGNISILLADDSITIQKVVGIIFATDGYTLTVVDNGKSAVQKAREIQPDVLLVDAIMPDMTGYEVCSEIRKDPELSAKPLLLLTGSFEPFDQQKAKDCGADDHIVKPFESALLISKVKELYELGKNRPGPSPAAAAVPEPAPAFVPEPPPAVLPEHAPEPALVPEPEPAVQFMDTEPVAIEVPAEKALEAPQIEISPDDPWGAYSTVLPEPDPADAFTAPEKEDVPAEEDSFQPDVMEIMSQETAAIASPEASEASVAASWTPVDEQIFEYRDDVVEAPPSLLAEAVAQSEVPEQEQPFDSTAFEPVSAVEPVSEKVAEMPQDVPPVVPVAAMALTEEQLKEALLSASRETIERIVWEVVPELAETMIREAIRRITEGK